MSVGRLVERGLIGGLFIGHGTQKLFGWFGGPGRAGTEGMMTALGMHPAKANALAAGLTETAGGALIVAGLGTPAAAGAGHGDELRLLVGDQRDHDVAGAPARPRHLDDDLGQVAGGAARRPLDEQRDGVGVRGGHPAAGWSGCRCSHRTT